MRLMCFSAQASFIVGTTLTVAGAATLRRGDSWRGAPPAAAPLLFAPPPFIQGALWLRLGSGTDDAVTATLVHSFLLFAEVLWPVLLPIIALLVEPEARRRRLMAPFIPWGLAVGGYLLVCMILSPYEATIYNDHILYSSEMKRAVGTEYVYLIGISVPLVLSSHRTLMLMGVLGAVLLVFTKHYTPMTYVSVSCYFAAVTSIMVFVHFYARSDLRGRSERTA